MKVDRVRVGEVLQLRRRSVSIEPDVEYREIGVRSFGRGIFHKEPVTGFELGGKRVFRIEPNDLVLSNVFAWEGAIALASVAEAGRIGSHRFMTFTAVDDRLDMSWARWWFLSEPGLELIGRASPGSAGRNRTLAIDRFEELEIPLPPLGEQRRVAALLDHVDRTLTQAVRPIAATSHAGVEALTASALQRMAADLRRRYPDTVTLGDVGHWTSGGTPSAKNAAYYDGDLPWAVIGDLNDGLVCETARTITREGLANSSAKVISPGTVLVAMYGSIGKLGLAGIEMTTNQAIACCSPDYAIVTADYLMSFLRSIRVELVELGQGGAQQNISQSILKGVPIPTPTFEVQQVFVEDVTALIHRTAEVSGTLRHRDALISSVVPAALNSAFAGIN